MPRKPVNLTVSAAAPVDGSGPTEGFSSAQDGQNPIIGTDKFEANGLIVDKSGAQLLARYYLLAFLDHAFYHYNSRRSATWRDG
jgi:hypothetical protein